MLFWPYEESAWPLIASITWEVKNDHAHVIMQDICNKFIEINFCVGCMVSQPNCLQQRLTTMSLINRILRNYLMCREAIYFHMILDPETLCLQIWPLLEAGAQKAIKKAGWVRGLMAISLKAALSCVARIWSNQEKWRRITFFCFWSPLAILFKP